MGRHELRGKHLMAAACAFGLSVVTTAIAQEAPLPVEPAPPSADQRPAVRFAFSDASVKQVLDFFSREAGVPIVYEVKAPDQKITFLSGTAYPYDEALRILNTILQTRGVVLRADERFLYLQKLENMKAEAVPTYTDGQIPDSVGDEEIISVLKPLQNAASPRVADQLKGLVAGYGAIIALPDQNALLITETAGQCRRLLGIIDSLDAEPAFEESVQTFRIVHLRAKDVMESLKVLVAERQRTVFIDEGGNRRELAKDELVGLRMQADERTNTIIALGPEGRLRTLESLIKLIDVPAGAGGEDARTMRTFTVNTLPPAQAKRVIEAIFVREPEAMRPVIVPLEAVSKITVLGAAGDVERVGGVLAELEGRSAGELAGGPDAPTAEVVPLASPDALRVIESVQRLLVPRQQRLVRIAATPDGRGVLVSGLAADVESVSALVRVVDASSQRPPQVRTFAFETPIDQSVVDAAADVFAALRPGVELDDLNARLNSDGTALTVVATSEDIEAFAAALGTARETVRVRTETRSFRAERVPAAEIVSELGKTVRPLLLAQGIAEVGEVQAEAVERLGLVIVTASPSQFAAIEEAVRALDVPADQRLQVQVVDLGDVDPRAVAERAEGLMATTAEGLTESERGTVSWEVDEDTGKLLLTGNTAGLARFNAVLSGAMELTPSASTAALAPPRLFPLRTADAQAIARTLTEQYDARPPEERREKPLRVRADQATNTLIVSAHPEVLSEVSTIIADLNQDPTFDDEDREIRIFPLRIARATDLARTLDEMFPEPPVPLDRRGRPVPALKPQREVIVRSDAQTNSLIVDAPTKRMSGFEELVRQLDRAEIGADVALRTYRVENADPNETAETLRRLASGGAFMTEGATGSAPVRVDLAQQTRTLIVTGPESIFEPFELVLAELDVAPLVPETVLRFYSLTNARADQAARVVERVLDGRVRAYLSEQNLDSALAGDVLEVVADAGANTLIVTLPAALEDAARETIGRIDTAGSAGPEVVRVITLDQASATEVVRSVNDALSGRALPSGGGVRLSAAESSNAIVVSGVEADVRFVRELVAELDRPAATDRVAVRSVVLEHAQAERVAPLVARLLEAERMSEWMRYNIRMNRRGGEPEPEQIRAEADARTNAVIITGPPELLPVALELIARLDVPADGTMPADSRPVRVITLKNASAQTVSGNIAALFAESVTDAVPPVVRVDTEANAMLIRADAGQMAEIEALVSAIDGAAMPASRELRRVVVDPSRSDAAALAETLRRMLTERGGLRVEVIDAADLVGDNEIEAGEAGSDEGEEAIEPASEEVRSKILLPRRTRMILKFVQTVTVAGEEDEPEPDVVITVDPRTNAILLMGSARATARAEEMLRVLQEQLPPDPGRVRLVNLPDGVPAWTVANVINATASRLGRISDQNPGGLTGAVSVVADPRGGALVIACNDTDFEVIGPLVGSLAQPGDATDVAVRVYELGSVPADRAVGVVRELLSPPGVRRGDLVSIELPAAQGEPAEDVTFRAGAVRVSRGPSGASIIVAGPPEAMPLVDRFVARLDSEAPAATGTIRRFEIRHGDAGRLAGTLRGLFTGVQRSAPRGSVRGATFTADQRTNTLLVAGTDDQLAQVEALLVTLDAPDVSADAEARLFRIESSDPRSVARVLDSVLSADTEAGADTRVDAEQSLGLVIVRGPKEALERAETLITELDTDAAAAHASETIKLERASADEVARALQRFFDDRARAAVTPGQRPQRRVSVVGDRRTGTLLVSASEEDLAEVRSLVEVFDAPAEARDLRFRVFPLENASVATVLPTIESLAQELRWSGLETWEQGLIIRGDSRTNSIIALGRGNSFQLVESIVARLDEPADAGAKSAVRVFRVESADLDVIERTVSQAFTDTSRRWWEPQDPTEPRIEVDERARSLIVIAPEETLDRVGELVAQLDIEPDGVAQSVETIALTFADAARTAQSLNNFFRDRARLEGLRRPRLTVIGSQAGNALILSGPAEDMALAQDIAARLDMPESADNQRIEIFALEHGQARDVVNAIRQLFPRRGRNDSRVSAVPDVRTNSVIVSSPEETFAEVAALVDRLDEFPEAEAVTIRTFSLQTARADEVARTLTETLALNGNAGDTTRFVDDAGEPIEVNARVTADERSNTLLVTADEASMRLVAGLVDELDDQPTVMEREYRVIPLEHVLAADISNTLRTLVGRRAGSDGQLPPNITSSRTDNTLLVSATAGQFDEISKILEELDVPGRDRRVTEFVPLQFADAEQVRRAITVFYGRFASAADTPGARNVSIVADTATNSLVVSAEPDEWDGIRELISKLDAEEYDASRRLEVLALQHADAASVAQAINRAFEAPLRAELRREQRERERRNDRGRDDAGFFSVPDVLVEQEEIVSVSAEPLTNTLIVSATKRDLDRVKAIVDRIDVPEFAALEPPRVIALSSGALEASAIAQALRTMYQTGEDGNRGQRGGVRIVGDDEADVLIVRAEDDVFEQIRTLAFSLAESGTSGAVRPRVLAVVGQPAARLRETIAPAFQTAARARGEAFGIEVDRRSNALVVAASAELFEEVREVVEALNARPTGAEDDPDAAPAAGVGSGELRLAIIELQRLEASDLSRLVDQLGLTAPVQGTAPRVLSEPVRVVPLPGRRAVGLLVAPADEAAARSIVSSLDAQSEGALEVQDVAVVRLESAVAGRVVDSVNRVLDAEREGARTGLASALSEQVRRLRLASDRTFGVGIEVDLTVPVRLFAEAQTNSVVVSSDPANVAAVAELVRIFDALPEGDAVVVRIFHMQQAAASETARVLRELFASGEALRRTPGTSIASEPTTETGRALMGEIVLSVDDRTNALIVGGREEAVALAEVLVGELDSTEAAKWVEPRLIPLRFADATDIAGTVRSVLVEGAADTPAADALRRQAARIRLANEGGDVVESEMLVPMSRLQIIANEALNALLVTGAPGDVDVVEELVGLLDVEGASRFDAVRFYPLEHAAADRVADLLDGLFAEQRASGALRDDDELVLRADVRTNALVIATSPRSFAVVEALLRSLDVEEAKSTVGLHVVAVPNGDARALAQKIESVMQDRLRAMDQSGADRRDVVSIEADEASRSLIVAASDENLRLIEQLVDLLASEEAQELGGFEVIPVALAKAQDLVPLLEELYVREAIRARGDGAVRIRSDERLNAVVVAGTEEDVRAIRELVGRLDSVATNSVREIKIIEMTSANALEMVSLLENVLSGRSLAGRTAGAVQSTLLRFVREQAAAELGVEADPDTLSETEVSAAIRERVSLTPDLRTNAIVVAAPPQMMVLIEKMIAELDSSASGSRDIRVFALENADAENMAEILRDLFNLRRQGNLFVLVPNSVPGVDNDDEQLGDRLGMGDVTLSVVPDERQALSITIDARTNSLLVSGTPTYLDLVASVVDDLDAKTGTERERFTVELKNAAADEVAGALQDFVDQEQDRMEQALGPDREGSVLRRLEREISVVGVPGSNRLIVSVSPRYRDTVQSLIDELDRPPAQVLIQVLLAEVTLDSEESWGLDFTLNPLGGSQTGGAYRSGGTGVLTAIGVPNLSVSSLDFELLVRALEVQGRLEVLSRPQILVNDNERAEIQVGETIQLVTDVERLDNGNVRSDVESRELGVVLSVLPSISPDGFVRLEIAPEISALTTRTTQVSEDFSAPVISQRRADTTVTVRNGQTIVIGGLIQNNTERRVNKVPVLGDIPVVGLPFRAERTTNTKTELLIILTPQVIFTETDEYIRTMGEITEREVDRLSLPGNIRNSLLRNTVIDNNVEKFDEVFDADELDSAGSGAAPGGDEE